MRVLVQEACALPPKRAQRHPRAQAALLRASARRSSSASMRGTARADGRSDDSSSSDSTYAHLRHAQLDLRLVRPPARHGTPDDARADHPRRDRLGRSRPSGAAAPASRHATSTSSARPLLAGPGRIADDRSRSLPSWSARAPLVEDLRARAPSASGRRRTRRPRHRPHADLRAAPAARGHRLPARGALRRRRLDRHHPRRLVLPVVHLPHPAQHGRARALRRTSTRSTAMLFPSICDVIRNLGGMWRMLFPKAYATYLDLPQNFEPDIGGSVLRERAAAHRPRARGARRATARRRRAARGDRARGSSGARAIAELDAAPPRRSPGACAASRGLPRRPGRAPCSTADAHTALAPTSSSRAARQRDGARRSTTSASCSSGALLRAAAASSSSARSRRAGCDIVDDDFQLGMRMIDGPIDAARRRGPARRARARLSSSRAQDTASRYIGDLVKGAALVRRVQRVRAPTASSSRPRRSAIRRCSISRCSKRALDEAPASRTRASSSPRTSGQFQRHSRASRRVQRRRQALGSRSHDASRLDDVAQSTRTRASSAQKQMIADHFDKLARAQGGRARRSSTPSCPGTSPSCSARSICCRCCPRSTRCSPACASSSAGYIAEAEKAGHSEDVCTYVKCDVGMLQERQHRARPGRSCPSRISCCSRTRAASRS